MATQRICSIPNCGKPHWGHGWCAAHHGRWLRHGDPLGGRTPEGVPLAFLEGVVLSYSSRDCLIWPFSKVHGYGKVKINGSDVRVHRYVCARANGDPPSPEYEAAHNCGNASCVNPAHIRWATPSENQQDRVVHGTDSRGVKHPLAKLSESEIKEIRRLDGKFSCPQIAAKFGVTAASVSNIIRRKSWRHLT